VLVVNACSSLAAFLSSPHIVFPFITSSSALLTSTSSTCAPEGGYLDKSYDRFNEKKRLNAAHLLESARAPTIPSHRRPGLENDVGDVADKVLGVTRFVSAVLAAVEPL
jgi:hypothetical protein